MVMQEEPTPYIVKCAATASEHESNLNFATLLTEQIFDEEEAEVEITWEGEGAKKSKQKTIGIYAYVNRILLKVYGHNKIDNMPLTTGLSSQSFRRGAAQHANANPELSAQWIGDRGGWQMFAVPTA